MKKSRTVAELGQQALANKLAGEQQELPMRAHFEGVLCKCGVINRRPSRRKCRRCGDQLAKATSKEVWQLTLPGLFKTEHQTTADPVEPSPGT